MRVTANGIEMEYRWDGPEDDGGVSGPPVLLSHSLATRLELWNPQVVGSAGSGQGGDDVTAAGAGPRLAERYRVLRYDIRGHGRSSAPAGPYSLELLADDVCALLDALEVERVHFVGLSLGGMIGQMFALQRPSRLVSLVLCGSPLRTPPEARALWQERIALALAEGMEAHAPTTIARWFTPAFLAAQPLMVAWVEDMIRQTPRTGYAGCAAAVSRHNASGRLLQVRVPTLVMAGSDDPGVPPEAARLLKKAIPGARLTVIGPASHLMNVEQPRQFTRAVLEFLDGQTPSAPGAG